MSSSSIETNEEEKKRRTSSAFLLYLTSSTRRQWQRDGLGIVGELFSFFVAAVVTVVVAVVDGVAADARHGDRGVYLDQYLVF